MSQLSDLYGLVVYRPLDGDVELEERRAPFSAPWRATVRLLRDELRFLGASHAVMEVDLRERDLRQDGMPRADRSPRSPAVVLSFRADGLDGSPTLRYAVGTFARWADNVRAIALGLEKLRAVDRYGITKRSEQYAGWKALPAGHVGDGDPTRGRVLIEAAGGNWKRAAALAHPDLGGQPDDFKDVIAARDAARAAEGAGW